jgi:cytochrome c-type biogenesis protein CcmH
MVLDSIASAAARRSFGLGLGCGLLLACIGLLIQHRFATPSTVSASAGEPAVASGATWQHPAPSGDLAAAVGVSAALLSGARPGVAAGPVAMGGGVQEMLARAEQHRRQREFDQACELYAAVAAQGGMTADAWADFADAQASVNGRLAGAPARAIEAALALEPRHAKALWLQASLAHEERRYTDALATWRRLLAVVPPGSTDAKIIESNIAEATRLAAG